MEGRVQQRKRACALKIGSIVLFLLGNIRGWAYGFLARFFEAHKSIRRLLIVTP
jgi:hypothetical protein